MWEEWSELEMYLLAPSSMISMYVNRDGWPHGWKEVTGLILHTCHILINCHIMQNTESMEYSMIVMYTDQSIDSNIVK